MCLLFFYSLFLFTLFIQAFSLLFLALLSHPLPLSTSSHRLAVVLIADLSENRALIFSSPKLCPAKLTPLALTFC